jgi:hypothetical protein
LKVKAKIADFQDLAEQALQLARVVLAAQKADGNG